MLNEKIDKLRKKIDRIDNKITDLLNLRAKIIVEIGKIKKNLNIEVYHPQREKEILERLKKRSNILTHVSIEAIWKEIINACRLIQT